MCGIHPISSANMYVCTKVYLQLKFIFLIAPIMKCPFPNELKDGEMEYRGRLVGSIIYFQCDDGYWLKGSPKWTCLPNGTWSTNDTRCEGQ